MGQAGKVWAQKPPNTMSRTFYGHTALCLFATFTLTMAAQSPAETTPQAPDRAASYYHYMLAHEYEEMATTSGRPEYATRAIEEYKLALNADPDSKYLNNGLAEIYFRTGRIRDAIVAAQDQIKKDPNSLEAHKLLGGIYWQSLEGTQQNSASGQMIELAIAEYKKIVDLEPDSIENHLKLGRLYAVNHDSLHAEEQFRAAQKIDPGSEETALNIAGLYIEQGDLKRAIQILNALPSGDQTARTQFALGTVYDQLKETKNAIAAYRKAADLEPDNLDVSRALAKALLGDGQNDAALAAYKDIAAGDPSDADAYLHISDIERKQGKFEAALATLKKAKSLASDSVEINYNEALLEDAVGHYDEAAQNLEKLAKDSEHPSGQYSPSEKNNRYLFLDRLASVYREQNKIDLAVATYQKMADLGGDFALQAYESQVDAYRDAHQYDKATQVAREAAEKLPKDSGVKLMLAKQLTDTGRTEEGLNLAKSLLSNGANDRNIYLRLAEMYTSLRKWKEAGEALDQAEKLSTKPNEKLAVYFLRGALEERQKHYDAAEVEFRKVLAIDANNSTTLNYYGYMLADRGVRLNEALGMIQKAVQLDPTNYAYLDSLGWAYFKLGQYTRAEEDLRKASERNSTEPTVHDHLGELYEKTGRLKLAAAQWEESLNEYARTIASETDPNDVSKVQKKLDSARVRLAKESSSIQPIKQ